MHEKQGSREAGIEIIAITTQTTAPHNNAQSAPPGGWQPNFFFSMGALQQSAHPRLAWGGHTRGNRRGPNHPCLILDRIHRFGWIQCCATPWGPYSIWYHDPLQLRRIPLSALFGRIQSANLLLGERDRQQGGRPRTVLSSPQAR